MDTKVCVCWWGGGGGGLNIYQTVTLDTAVVVKTQIESQSGGKFPLCLFSLHRASYRSAHVLLYLLKEFGERYIMCGLPSILSLLQQV